MARRLVNWYVITSFQGTAQASRRLPRPLPKSRTRSPRFSRRPRSSTPSTHVTSYQAPTCMDDTHTHEYTHARPHTHTHTHTHTQHTHNAHALTHIHTHTYTYEVVFGESDIWQRNWGHELYPTFTVCIHTMSPETLQ